VLDGLVSAVKEHHHHLVCVRCRKVVDVDAPALDSLLDTCRSLGGFEVLGGVVELRGLCAGCRQAEPGDGA